MKLTFITNLIHHHQIPLAEEFYKKLGSNYCFITTEDMPEFLVKGGYQEFTNKKYLLKANESKTNYIKAMALARNSDVVIIGAAPNSYIKERLSNNKLTFRYSERMFKKIDHKLLNPKGWYYKFKNHTIYRNKNFYLLCSGAFVAKDYSRILSYPNKKLKWGYFTNIEQLNINEILKKKSKAKPEILWTGRFIDWKHPELLVYAANELKRNGLHFHINMIGGGELFTDIKNLINSLKLNSYISLLGNMPNSEVREHMLNSDIFVFTSNRQEGWGAVLNEAMSSLCAIVASDRIGSVPYLLSHKQNGMIFQSENLKSLVQNIAELIIDNKQREILAVNAYETICKEWSPRKAANNFLKISEAILNDKIIKVPYGPCSPA